MMILIMIFQHIFQSTKLNQPIQPVPNELLRKTNHLRQLLADHRKAAKHSVGFKCAVVQPKGLDDDENVENCWQIKIQKCKNEENQIVSLPTTLYSSPTIPKWLTTFTGNQEYLDEFGPNSLQINWWTTNRSNAKGLKLKNFKIFQSFQVSSCENS